MGKAYRQTLALLSVVNGSLNTIYNHNMIPGLEPTILYGIELGRTCIRNFPEEGNPRSNEKWVVERLSFIKKELGKEPLIGHQVTLAYLANYIMHDLTEKIKDPVKLEYLLPIRDTTIAITDAIDGKGDHFESYEHADRLLKILYGEIAFVR